MNKIFIFIIAVILVISCHNPSNKNRDVIENGIRIVSLAPSISKELESLNMTENIVGATSYCDISKNNEELIVGTATEVNIEKILLLNPDIVIASGLTKQTTINTLKNNGIAVHFIKKLQSFDDICNQAIELGKLVGKADLALSIVNRSRQRVDSMQSLIPSRDNKLKVFFQIGAKPIFTVIPNTFMNDYIIFSGCENLAADMNRGTITRESVLRRNPDVIFIVTMGILGDEEKNTWESYDELNAVKSKKIFIIDSNIACTPTVLSFTETLEQVIKKIY